MENKERFIILTPTVAGKEDGVYTVVNSDMVTMFYGTAKECSDYVNSDFKTTEEEAQFNSNIDNFEKFFGTVRLIDK